MLPLYHYYTEIVILSTSLISEISRLMLWELKFQASVSKLDCFGVLRYSYEIRQYKHSKIKVKISYVLPFYVCEKGFFPADAVRSMMLVTVAYKITAGPAVLNLLFTLKFTKGSDAVDVVWKTELISLSFFAEVWIVFLSQCWTILNKSVMICLAAWKVTFGKMWIVVTQARRLIHWRKMS